MPETVDRFSALIQSVFRPLEDYGGLGGAVLVVVFAHRHAELALEHLH